MNSFALFTSLLNIKMIIKKVRFETDSLFTKPKPYYEFLFLFSWGERRKISGFFFHSNFPFFFVKALLLRCFVY